MDYFLLIKINHLAGKWIAFDQFGIICADGLIFLIPLIILLVYFLSPKRKEISLIVLKIIGAIACGLLINNFIDLFYHRLRPFVEHREVFQLIKFLASPKDYSFPSYHTTIGFIMALTVLKDWKKFGIILLILALLVGVSRIFVGVHWPSDILGGIVSAILSVFIVNITVKKLWKL
ncbi:MAG: phosphatase PAP2 family protein [Patescibacteria group bacterium]|nr:phosphatase PAP2 family protein [Patescibacteria group bacterium]